jgi:hypothetical protein
LLDNFLSQLNEEDILQLLSEKVIGKQMKDSSNRLVNYSKRKTLEISSTLRRRNQIIFKTSQDEYYVYLTFYNKTLSFPIFNGEAINYITTIDKFKPTDITGLSSDIDKLNLSNKLIDEGFLTIG